MVAVVMLCCGEVREPEEREGLSKCVGCTGHAFSRSLASFRADVDLGQSYLYVVVESQPHPEHRAQPYQSRATMTNNEGDEQAQGGQRPNLTLSEAFEAYLENIRARGVRRHHRRCQPTSQTSTHKYSGLTGSVNGGGGSGRRKRPRGRNWRPRRRNWRAPRGRNRP